MRRSMTRRTSLQYILALIERGLSKLYHYSFNIKTAPRYAASAGSAANTLQQPAYAKGTRLRVTVRSGGGCQEGTSRRSRGDPAGKQYHWSSVSSVAFDFVPLRGWPERTLEALAWPCYTRRFRAPITCCVGNKHCQIQRRDKLWRLISRGLECKVGICKTNRVGPQLVTARPGSRRGSC